MNIYSRIKTITKYSALEILTNPIRIKNRFHKMSNKNYLNILNLHRVSNNNDSAYEALDQKIFRKLIIYLMKNYEITSFKELRDSCFDEITHKKKPKVILSFDDGYKDFLEIVHPILVEYGIRANQNIIPSCVESGLPPLNVYLQDYIGKNIKENYFNLKIPNYKWDKRLNKIQEGIKLSTFIKNKPHYEQRDIANYCFEQIGENIFNQATKMMNKKDIISIKDYHDIGVHSFSHSNMAIETNDYFIKDLEFCSKWFLDNLNLKPYIYAFPNGSYKEQNLKIALKKGYKHLLLVDDNFSGIENNIHPRFNFHALTTKEMIFKATGSFTKL